MMRSHSAASISAVAVESPHELDEHPPEVTAAFIASKSKGARLSSEIVIGELMVASLVWQCRQREWQTVCQVITLCFYDVLIDCRSASTTKDIILSGCRQGAWRLGPLRGRPFTLPFPTPLSNRLGTDGLEASSFEIRSYRSKGARSPIAKGDLVKFYCKPARKSKDQVKLTGRGAAEARTSCRPPRATISKHLSRKLRRCIRGSLWVARVRNTPHGPG